MSSLAATQADGYYLPPDYFDSGAYKRQGKNSWYNNNNNNNAAKNGDGTKKTNTTSSSLPVALVPVVVVVRFELVDPCVCESCEARIGKGTRFNATKKQIGNYLDQDDCPIFEFQTKCRSCRQTFSIRTDPARRGFSYGPGIRRQERDWDAQDIQDPSRLEEDNSFHDDDEDDSESLEKLILTNRQHKKRLRTEMEELKAIQDFNQRLYQDDSLQNSQVRKIFRVERRERNQKARLAQSKGWWRSTHAYSSQYPTIDDQCQAAEQTFGPSIGLLEHQKWRNVRKSSIFQQQDPSGKKTTRHSLEQPSCNPGHAAGEKDKVLPDISVSSAPRPPHVGAKRDVQASTVDLTVPDDPEINPKQRSVKRIVLPSLTGGMIAASTTLNKKTTGRGISSLLEAYTSSSSDGEG